MNRGVINQRVEQCCSRKHCSGPWCWRSHRAYWISLLTVVWRLQSVPATGILSLLWPAVLAHGCEAHHCACTHCLHTVLRFGLNLSGILKRSNMLWTRLWDYTQANTEWIEWIHIYWRFSFAVLLFSTWWKAWICFANLWIRLAIVGPQVDIHIIPLQFVVQCSCLLCSPALCLLSLEASQGFFAQYP